MPYVRATYNMAFLWRSGRMIFEQKCRTKNGICARRKRGCGLIVFRKSINVDTIRMFDRRKTLVPNRPLRRKAREISKISSACLQDMERRLSTTGSSIQILPGTVAQAWVYSKPCWECSLDPQLQGSTLSHGVTPTSVSKQPPLRTEQQPKLSVHADEQQRTHT